MYLKVIGMFIAFVSCISMGRLMSEKYNKRYFQLLAVEDIVNCFEMEICYTYTPVVEILDSLIPRVKPPLNHVLKEVLIDLKQYGYRPLSESWEEVVINSKSNLCLKSSDIDILIEFEKYSCRHQPNKTEIVILLR